uniref:Uncharacterized protein n=1 Tax=Oryza barthii TaxID=65489 RepID=A0A0D3H765_9ORYZ
MAHGSREVWLPAGPASDAREGEGVVGGGSWPEEEVIKDKLMDAIEGHVLGEAELMAVFEDANSLHFDIPSARRYLP